MGLLNKSELLKMLRSIVGFDVNASPFAAVQLVNDEDPSLFRSSHTGFIQSKNYGGDDLSYVLLSHLKDSLQVLRDEAIEITRDTNGVLRISSTDNVYESEIRVHTVREEQAGLKHHDIGDIAYRLPPHIFKDFDSRPFTCAAQPTLVKGRIMIPTQSGIIIWRGPAELAPLELFPRESFLKFISGGGVLERVVVSSKGYWGAASGGLISFISGHNTGAALYNTYNFTAKPLDNLPADRLVVALDAVSGMCGDNKIEICPTQGITTRDMTGNQSKFSIGHHTGWDKFAITGKTAKTVVDALKQSADTEATLSQGPNQTIRITRGNWECNFRSY